MSDENCIFKKLKKFVIFFREQIYLNHKLVLFILKNNNFIFHILNKLMNFSLFYRI